MIIILYIAVYLLLNAYVIWRVLRWLRHCNDRLASWPVRTSYIVVFAAFASLIIIAYYIHDERFVWLERLSSAWFGILLYIIFYVAMADLARVIAKLVIRFIPSCPKDVFAKKRVLLPGGIVVIALVVITSAYGFYHVDDLQTKYYEVPIEKVNNAKDSMRIVLVADQHLGFIMGADYMEEVTEEINRLKPDLVCFAGDIFDNDYDALDDPERIINAWKNIESTYGVYACWGNHDVTEPLFSGFAVGLRQDAIRDIRMDNMMRDANITVMEDETLLIDDSFYLIGRLDYSKNGFGTNERMDIEDLLEGVDQSKPIILMDHEPKELDRIAEAGVDLDLSGHTHDGQMWPMNLTNRVVWENNYGMLIKGNMYSIVTSGLGVYGPSMRVATDSEVVVVDVNFVK